ncbi:MAG: alpha/beta hydrolase, partial [Planctomycetota bacterium]
MASNVVFRVARGLREAGLAVVRFNFRGVGESEGAPMGPGRLEDPSGEVDDLRAVLHWLGGEHPDLELWAGGYSFGA